ncbi:MULTISPECIES: phosphoribosylanthranilate isomerase [Desulfitobacterium]|uniref:N-(5'-phosphoribosyl)anthranilate isomerase n=1 Tax=Desulfitobacterium dehalogenans (strain ATCC 51507 / DSM 9161 / JW/IU-DC1) TaxID=756499 RepID=I4ADI3_DESDJ|nr:MULTISPECIES: phosphoribosylanthranilate isomerase [Desulfitobacterium]AFM02018.1 phosphoribosylanthranilate isomerase [Desulfitobacterium dehalogenans ATCC 51507]
MPRIKICGIRTFEEARWAVEAGADALGFIFVPYSKRYIKPETAREIILRLPPWIGKVGVFAQESPKNVSQIIRGCPLDTLQLHGNEDPRLYHHLPVIKIKALSLPPVPDSASDADPTSQSFLAQFRGLPPASLHGILLDSALQGMAGGTGAPLPWHTPEFQDLLRRVKNLGYPLILAGGLSPDNVLEAIRLTQPYGVDVSSGVERDGRKNREKIQHFISRIRKEPPL